MKKVQVLMSTYNGEKYVVQQIQSLLDQDHRNLQILIRDDGSRDDTLSILEQFSRKNKNIIFIKGANEGVISSFFELVLNASEDADYYAFCDQDDFWKPSKVSRAVKLLDKEDSDVPLLYLSRLDIVDEQLSFLKHSQIPPQGISLKNAIIQNIATGCTIVFNKAMLTLFKSHIPQVEKVSMHDAWFYLLGTAFGKVIYDEQSHILYRQHSSNTLGMADNKLKSAVVRYKAFKKQGHLKPFTLQTEEFYRLFKPQLNGQQRKLIEDFLNNRNSFFRRLMYAGSTPLYRQNKRDTLIFKLLYSINKY
ncbi:glycosyltransferase family 2 protein [Bacillus sp. T33-2]|uniref:glycosyltransferase family 2 protein n=1 Tax=Bacillus sp. T33-2 TaxID=2054168 RepID=UPI0021557264|nr:glycosyltransferase family 2 protein [Bacillus sp. T33-2]